MCFKMTRKGDLDRNEVLLENSPNLRLKFPETSMKEVYSISAKWKPVPAQNFFLPSGHLLWDDTKSVSYTHLTLPTTPYV